MLYPRSWRSAVVVAGVGLAFLGKCLLDPRPAASADPVAKDAPPAARVPWQGSRVVGTPEPPPPYRPARVYPNATFKNPVMVTCGHALDRVFVADRPGVLYSLANKADATPEVFLDLRTELKTLGLRPDAKGVESVYGLAFHPRFAANRQCFVCYTLKAKDGKVKNLPDGTRVSRFTVLDTQPPRIDPTSEAILLTFLQGGHNGGDLHFGPDGFLYVSTGDSADPNPPDPLGTGQDVSDLLSSILRIDVDRKDAGKAYAVPADNPFFALKSARSEVWAYGFRNPWRMSFDRLTGDLWVGDVGWELWEMVYKVVKGGNYGWSLTEGPQPIKPGQKPGPTPVLRPDIELPHTIACSVTGGYVYRGRKFPELYGAYVFGDWETRRLWAARFENGRLKRMDDLTKPTVRVVSFGEDKDGELLILDYDTGTLHALEPSEAQGANAAFPTKLSDTGLFASAKDATPAAGVVPFRVTAEQWADGATAERWAAFPGTSGATAYPSARPLPGQVSWHNFRLQFPADAVLVKTFTLETEAGNPATRRRVETQLLHFDGVDWRAYTFAWRDDGTDADLVPAAGTEKVFALKDKDHPGGTREQVWTFQSRTQCLQCHSVRSEYALGFNLSQLNRAGPDGANQLVHFGTTGHLRRAAKDNAPLPPYDATTAAAEPKLADPSDPAQPLDGRARAYLHANCGHCHRDGGGGSVSLELHSKAKLEKAGVIDARPTRGDFGLPDARVVAPGQPERSTLYYRMAKFGRDRMPHIGSERPDEAGLKLVGEWIARLDGSKPTPPVPVPPDGVLAAALARPAEAVGLARLVAGPSLLPADRGRLLAAAAKLPTGPVRDLFDGYLPTNGKPRTLGSNPRPAAVLSLAGNAERGRALFASEGAKCATCHKVGDVGVNFGPDLSAIGKQRTREDLLESLLEPSRRIDPPFAPYVLRTTDGKTVSGLLVRRDEKEVVLRDTQNKEAAVPAADVESLQPSRVSLMPDGLLGPLTPQEAADLLDYLVGRK